MKHAPAYLSMKKNYFNKKMRPYLTEIPIGKQGIAFCRFELEKCFYNLMNHKGKPGTRFWEEKELQDECQTPQNEADTPFNERMLIGLKFAPSYLSMNKNYFNETVRPHLNEEKVGAQGVAFYRLALNEWADQYMKRVGRPGIKLLEKLSCQNEHQALQEEARSGTSTKSSKDIDFMKALERANLTKPRGS